MLDTAPDQNERAVIGDNNPPPADPLDTWKLCADTLHETAEGFSEITTDEQAASVEAAVEEVKEAIKGVKEAVKTGRKPHNDAANAVTASFAPILEKLELVDTVVVALRTAWRTEQTRLLKIEQDKAKKVAEEKEAEAARAAAEVDQTDTAALERVADIQRDAKTAKQDFKAVRSQKVASGGIRMVTIHDREITNWDTILRHVNAEDNAWLREQIDGWAKRKIHGGVREIPGMKITPRKVPQ